MSNYFITSESVTEGHPDKICDQISDAILDSYLDQDSFAHVACETVVTNDLVMVLGETQSYSTSVDVNAIVRSVLQDIGYTDSRLYGMDYDSCAVANYLHRQSRDISYSVSNSLETRNHPFDPQMLGAGDQGMVFGYACKDTDALMPAPIVYAHKLAQRLQYVRKSKILDYLGPDGKTQVTVEYVDGKPVRIDTIVVSTQHLPDIDLAKLQSDIFETVIAPVIPEILRSDTRCLVNPSGRFVIGGPKADTGLTGRKIIVDTYGGVGRHGGGAFSGKDPTKVDRSGAYAARWVAKNIVGAGLANKCEVQISYAIGVSDPVSVYVNTFGTGIIEDSKLSKIILDVFDLTPEGIINDLNLRHVKYRPVASYGHF